jgi:transposase
VRYAHKTSWTKTFYRWLGLLNFGAAGAQTAFTEYWQAVMAADERVKRLTDALAHSIEGWRFEPVVRALQALRGIDQVSAIGLVAEIGDIGRFAHPRQLMAYLGLVPSEYSSGDRVARGSITKTGNAHARRLLTEAAWNYRFQPRMGYRAQRRAEDLPQPIRDLGWKAQLRLTGRFARLRARGMHINKVCVAVARELAGFVWAIACTRAKLPQT